MGVRDRLPLFPDTTQIKSDSLHIGGLSLADLADKYGTPLYSYDAATMDSAAARYRKALKAHYPGESSLTYAGKALLCKAVAQWIRREHLWLDCTGEGELAVAAAGSVPPESVIVHGSNKSRADLGAAWQGARTVVIDNLDELTRLIDVLKAGRGTASPSMQAPAIWLRLQPGVQVETHHAYTETGQADSKFGMPATEIAAGIRLARSNDLKVSGLHFHLGSNFRSTAPLVEAIELALEVALEVGFGEGWHFSPGGGWGVAYHEDELPPPDTEVYVESISRTILRRCRSSGLPLPHLHLEPGRSLVARAGVAVYRVGGIKVREGRTWIITDGGMADNPRHALYGARYSCLTVKGTDRNFEQQVSIAGPYCESGDVLLEDLRMPQVRVGELLAIPVSGAYQLSMASNYNGARRPAVLWLEKSAARLIVRRETVEDLLRRDLSLA